MLFIGALKSALDEMCKAYLIGHLELVPSVLGHAYMAKEWRLVADLVPCFHCLPLSCAFAQPC